MRRDVAEDAPVCAHDDHQRPRARHGHMQEPTTLNQPQKRVRPLWDRKGQPRLARPRTLKQPQKRVRPRLAHDMTRRTLGLVTFGLFAALFLLAVAVPIGGALGAVLLAVVVLFAVALFAFRVGLLESL
jgi:Flp pilus assembly protein TadB